MLKNFWNMLENIQQLIMVFDFSRDFQEEFDKLVDLAMKNAKVSLLIVYVFVYVYVYVTYTWTSRVRVRVRVRVQLRSSRPLIYHEVNLEN